MGCIQEKKGTIEPKNKEELKERAEENKRKESKPDIKPNKSNKAYDITENPTIQKNNTNKITVETSRLIQKDSGRLEEHYKVLNKLGQGTFGSVYRVVHNKTDLIRAMKMIKKNTINLQDDDRKFLKEIQILIQIDHPNIIKIYEYFHDETYFYIITEFVSGGELYDTISKWKNFNEDKAAYIMRQLLSAVNYLHSYNIVHRDLKPENMMVEKTSKSKDKSSNDMINIKLIDFGTCNFFDGKTKLSLKVGTPYYIAPEVLRKSYNEKCDLWSCGVILYILLCGYPPFSGDTTEEIIEAVMSGKFSMEGSEWKKISNSAKDLVTKLLEIKQDKRLTAQESINHKWIQEKHEILDQKDKVDDNVWINVLENIKNFNAKEKLQQATIAFIIHHQFASQENKELKKIFKKLDINGDGRLTYKELKDGFSKLDPNERVSGITEADLNRIIEDVDQDMNGYIEYEEFLRVTVNKRNIISENNLRLAFDKFDVNGDGKLSMDEIKNVLGTTENEYIQEIIKKIDENNDGEINFSEFKVMMSKILEQDNKIEVSNTNKKLGFLNPTKTVVDFTQIDKIIEEKDGKKSTTSGTTKPLEEKILIDFEKDYK